VGVKEEVAKLVGDKNARHKRLIEYVLRQVGTGRSIAEVLEDPYVINRASTIDRRALLEEPEIVDAVGDRTLSAMRERLETLAGG
jgi:hypothetical protein